MNETAIKKSKRFVTVAEYQRQAGLSYATVMNMIKTGQVKYITTERGNYKIDTQAVGSPENNEIYNEVKEIKIHILAICRQLNTNL